MQEAARAFHDQPEKAEDTLFLLEHENVVTTTRSGGRNFLRTNEQALAADGIRLVEATRGGDITFHGRGQLVGYPIVRLPFMEGAPAGRVDLLKYLRTLETALVQACVSLGLSGAHTQAERTGVWVPLPAEAPASEAQTAKLIAIGVGVKRGITRHGFAFNLNTPLEEFTQHIVPCGLVGHSVTSMDRIWSSERDAGFPALPEIAQTVAERLAAGLGLQAPPKTDFASIPSALTR